MADKLRVAAYIRRALPGVDEMQLQKLLYFSHGWALAWYGRGIRDATFEAWVGGPVEPVVWRANHDDTLPADAPLSFEEQDVVDAVLVHYGHMRGGEMSDLTHAEGTPWSATRADLPARTGSQREISNQMIKDHFVELSIRGGVQPRRISHVTEPDPAYVEAAARVQAERWRATLDELATR